MSCMIPITTPVRKSELRKCDKIVTIQLPTHRTQAQHLKAIP